MSNFISIEIRQPTTDENIPGELIALCPIIDTDMHYDHPRIDIQLPSGFVFPNTPIPVAMYLNREHYNNPIFFGRLILGPGGLNADPIAPYTSPYFKIELTDPSQTPAPGAG